MFITDIARFVQDSTTTIPATPEQLSVLALFLLGLANKVIVSVVKTTTTFLSALPDWGKAFVALAFAQVIAFVNAHFLGLGLPELSPSVDALQTSLQALVVWVVSMGWHSFGKEVLKLKA